MAMKWWRNSSAEKVNEDDRIETNSVYMMADSGGWVHKHKWNN